MNQGTLDVVKQKVARVNIGILGITELKWEWEKLITMIIILTTVDMNPLEENGVALTVNKSPKWSNWMPSQKRQNDLFVSKANHSVSQ